MLDCRQIQFVENERVPPDATQTGETWRFVNKSGGPDRRFAGNRLLPVCAYGELQFSSSSGLNCLIQYSNADAGDRFARAVEILRREASRLEIKAITISGRPNGMFTAAFAAIFVVCSGLLFAASSVIGNDNRSRNTHLERTAPIAPTISVPDVVKTAPAKPAQPLRLNPLPDQPRPEGKRKEAAPSLHTRPSSIQQCLLIQDVDDRVECLEQFRIEMR